MNTFWLIVKAVFVIIPYVIQLIQEGKIREGTIDELEDALTARQKARLDAARAAKEGDPIDESIDPNNRATR